jgi:ribosomal protein S15P/S13E
MVKKKIEENKEKLVVEEPVKKEEKKKLSEAEYEKKVIELSKKGLTAEKIGEALRKERIHPKEYSKKISKILGKEYASPDLKNVETKLERIQNHFKTNKQDKRAMREKDRVFSQLRKIKKYLGLI